MMWTRSVLALLLIAALLQPAQGRNSFGQIMHALFGMSALFGTAQSMGWDLRELLSKS